MRRLVVPLVLLAAVTAAGCIGEPPSGLQCRATGAGNELSWDAVENATGYRIYRIEGENVTGLAETEDTHYTDTDVTKGTTYLYLVTAVFEQGESPPSECEVTAVPYFPSVLVGVLALVGAVGTYAVWKRR